MTQHTPGPWRIEDDANDQPNIYGPKDEWIALLPHSCLQTYLERAQANAHLIAAAPEMYEALALIAGNSCENYTSGPGTCLRGSHRTKDAKYTADRWCDACIALDAIKGIVQSQEVSR